MNRKIVFLTGTRADFGKLSPLMDIIEMDSNFECHIFVTGMHTLEKYGNTADEVYKKGYKNITVFNNQDDIIDQEAILANTVTGFSEYVKKISPDMIIVHGDKIETLAGAIVGAFNNILVSHIEGGEISGTIDEIYRHCNTKLCTVHLVSSAEAKSRVVQLGEHPDRVFIMGSPELDTHSKPSGISIDEVRARYDIPWKEFGIAIFHPVTSELSNLRAQANAFYSTLNESGKNFVIIAPNNDPGKEYIFSTINELPKKQFRLIPSMRFLYFSELLRHAKVLVGNSSAGVREAPFLGLPSLDIGTRQNKRHSSASIVQATAFEKSVIKDFLGKNWGEKYPKNTFFGTGDSSERFERILLGEKLWGLPLQKVFFDGG